MSRRAGWDWPEALVCVLAFLYNFPCGLVGFHPLDTSGSIDGAYRVFLGQVPVRDFDVIAGRLLWSALGLFHRLFGFSYGAFVGFGSLMNAAFAFLAMAVARRLGLDRPAALMAGLATAVWSVPIEHGYPWYEMSAFLLLFAALLLLAGREDRAPSARALAGAGVLVGLAFYEKQTAGALAGGFWTLYLVRTLGLRAAASFALWCFAGLLGGGFAWSALGGAEAVARDAFWAPWAHGRGRVFGLWELGRLLAGAGLGLGGAYYLPFSEWVVWVPMILVSVAGVSKALGAIAFLVPAAALAFMRRPADRALLMSLIGIQCGSWMLSYEQFYSFWYFLGVQLVLALRGASESLEGRGRDLAALGSPDLARWSRHILFGAAMLGGVRYGLLRKLSESWLMISFAGSLAAAGGVAAALLCLAAARRLERSRTTAFGLGPRGWAALSMAAGALCAAGFLHVGRTWSLKRAQGVEWGRPTARFRSTALPMLSGLKILEGQADDLEKAVTYLESLGPERRPFFVFPEYELLYPLLGQPPPHRFKNLWYGTGLGEDAEPYASVLCRILEENGVRTVVVHSDSPTRDIAGVPCLRRWLGSSFEEDARRGRFLFLRRKGQVPPPPHVHM